MKGYKIKIALPGNLLISKTLKLRDRIQSVSKLPNQDRNYFNEMFHPAARNYASQKPLKCEYPYQTADFLEGIGKQF